MKTLRAVTLLIIAILVFSAWTPSTALAKPAESLAVIAPSSPNLGVDPVVTKVVPLYIKNRTGGTLFVTIYGPKNYAFTIVGAKGKFLIVPGIYRVKAVSTACSGTLEVRKKFLSGGNLAYLCDSAISF
jgi:hypothetical protein